MLQPQTYNNSHNHNAMDSKLIECITVLSFIIIFGFVFTKILIDSEIKATKVKKSKKIKYLYQFITDDRTGPGPEDGNQHNSHYSDILKFSKF